ncbi:hypothetical protein [Streptomyces sp. MST-110588]|uniref:hypothetical protein n=1 Tax=Streptomyces sp. MST-110588 TaxID=2833628 RepID=UPI001F5C1C6D|nr:hypothetical protein [Streptomyces sp. MST-110588]UNO38366.1 hypothetical protein KGS77_00245 [Streptomyces sp. MST-110588]
MRPTPARILRRRLAQLDAAADPTTGTDAGLRHFTSVMTGWTEPEVTALAGGPAILAPSEVEEADEMADGCLLLGRLARDHRCLVRGPLDRMRQHWIGTSPHELVPHRRPALDRERFTAPGADPGPPSTKPFHQGLYTSTARRDGPGMWRMYLERGTSLHPRPWQTWELPVTDPAADVLDIGGASDWAAFVVRYPLVRGDDVYPDWAQAARDFAGVHMTLRAIVAAQGFRIPVAGGLAAAPYWDLESVLWLRWCFSTPRLVEITPPESRP